MSIAAAAAEAGTKFFNAAERLEESRQSLELVHQRRGLVPLKIAHERLQLEQHLAKALITLDAVEEDRAIQRVERARQQQLDAEDFGIARLRREADRQEQEARIAAAEAQLSLARQIGQRRGQAELARAEEELLRSQIAVEDERQLLREERRKRRQAKAPSEKDELPQPLKRHLSAEIEIRRNINLANRRAQQIKDRATFEGRELSDSEVEELDALRNAASAAEASIRRGEASDLEP